MATMSTATKPASIEKNITNEASGKYLRKQNRQEKRLERFQQKMEKRIVKLRKKGRIDASINLNFISLIVIALGGLFILLGIAIPIVGILFIVIGAIIAFVGLVMLLLLDGVKVNTGPSRSSH